MQESKKHFVYKIIDTLTKETVYIGETTNIKQRLSGHEHMNKERNAVYTVCDSLELGKTLEFLLIYKLKPKLNKSIAKSEPPNVYNFDIEKLQWIIHFSSRKTIPICDRYLVAHKVTGEEIPIEEFIELINKWAGSNETSDSCRKQKVEIK